MSGNVHAFLPGQHIGRDGGKHSASPAVDVYGHADLFGNMESVVRTARCFTTVSVGYVELGMLRISDWEHLLVNVHVCAYSGLLAQ